MRNAKTQEEVELLEKFIIAKYETEEHAMIQENSQCVQNHSKVSQYWQTKQG